jgi:hypothetical protein
LLLPEASAASMRQVGILQRVHPWVWTPDTRPHPRPLCQERQIEQFRIPTSQPKASIIGVP